MNSTGQIKFMGPAQQEFNTFQEQANYFLDTYWPHWRQMSENVQSESYIIPPTFYYKRPEENDEAFRRAKEEKMDRNTKDPNPLIKDRGSDEAEHVVYKAITQLIQEKFLAPFIAIHNLDIEKIKNKLAQIFPEIQWTEMINTFKSCFRQYDFVMIGPIIGIVFIEVKHSFFTQTKHFSKDNKYLPNDLVHGLHQLESASEFLRLLQECTKVKLPDGIQTRKILFTPNLERDRFEKWMNHLETVDSRQVNWVHEKIRKTIQWFKESLENTETKKPPLYDTLRQQLANGDQIPRNIFEAYSPIIAALASVIVLENKPGRTFQLDKLNFSENEAIMAESDQIVCQRPVRKANRIKNQNSITTSKNPPDPIVESIEFASKAIILTPEQQMVLAGSKRQFIIGAAGTGKTIVLQTKALELLKQDQSVLILAPANCLMKYAELFDNYEYKNYKLLHWPADPELAEFSAFCEDLTSKMQLDQGKTEVIDYTNDTMSRIYTTVLSEQKHRRKNIQEIFKWLFKYDHVFIDDAFDNQLPDIHRDKRWYIVYCLVIMAFAECAYSQHLVWIATDAYKGGRKRPEDNFLHLPLRLLTNPSISSNHFDDMYYSTTILRKVMRCPENVFNSAHCLQTDWSLKVQPLLGHKIQGVGICTPIEMNCSTEDEAMDAIWNELVEQVHHLSESSVATDHVAIIINFPAHRNIDGKADFRTFMKRYSKQTFDENKIVVLEKGAYLHADGKTFAIYQWDQVSSLEWPVIIYAICASAIQLQKRSTCITYERYRALSRATAKAIEIVATFEEQKRRQ